MAGMRRNPLAARRTGRPQNASVSGGASFSDFSELFGMGAPVASGQVVTPESAMRFSAVFACVRLLGGAVASAPVKVYLREGTEQRQLAHGHPLADVLRLRPNRFMTSTTFWKTFVAHKVLQGNGYAHIIRARSGEPVGVYPLNPRNVVVYWAWELGLDQRLGVERNRLFYRVTFEDGQARLYDQDDMLHVPNVGWDGKRGLGLAAEESSARFFSNGMLSKIALTYPGKLDPKVADDLREFFDARYTGTANHHRPLLLTEGGEAKTLSMSAEDAQLIESRQFSVIDICRFFGVPPVMIGETEKTSSWGSGVEQMARWFTTFTLNDHLTAIEQELEAKLFRDGFFAEFDESELTRGDTKTRGEFYRIARGSMLYLYDVIVSDDYWGGVAAETFVKELNATAAPTIHLRINSPGGEVFAARAIEAAIRNHPARIVAHVDGYAASAASFVAVACDEVEIAPGGFFMIHKAWTFTAGNADDLLHTAEMLEKLDASLVDTYAKKTGCTPEEIAGWMKAETWFSAGESVERGFADRVAEAAPKAQADWNLSVYANAPVVPAAAASVNPQNRERYERTARLFAVTRH